MYISEYLFVCFSMYLIYLILYTLSNRYSLCIYLYSCAHTDLHTHTHTHTRVCVCIAVRVHFHLMLTSVSTCNMLSKIYNLSHVATFMARGIVAVAYGATSVIT